MSGSLEAANGARLPGVDDEVAGKELEQASTSLQSSHTRSVTSPATSELLLDDAHSRFDLPRSQSSHSVMATESSSSSTNPYAGLQYAPRQKLTPANRPSQSSFQSHSSLWRQQQSPNSNVFPLDSASPSILSALPNSTAHASSPVLSTLAIEGLPTSTEQGQSSADQISAAERLSKQQLRADAEEMGVRVGSLGWAILDRIQSAPNAEWSELGELLSKGEATLLLPTSPLKSNEVTLSHAYNHIIFSTSPSSPPTFFSSSVKGKERATTSLVSFKGLRADLIDDADQSDLLLQFKSFIPREDMKFVSQLRSASRRQGLFSTLAALPVPSYHSLSSLPHFKVLTYTTNLLLPPSLSRKEVRTLRPRSSSSGPLLSPEQKQANRASATFATLFGGRREKRTSMAGFNDDGRELKEIGDYSANEGLGGEIVQVVQPTRSIAVAVIDGEVRRSQVLNDLTTSMKARIRNQLTKDEKRTAALPSDIIDVVCSFAAMFVPPPTSSIAHSIPGNESMSVSTDTDLLKSPGNAPLLAPFLLSPDQLADSFQDFYNSIKSQIEEAGSQFNVEQELQRIEAIVCSEVYDRIFCPYSSMDVYHDEALCTRIKNLCQMGINLQHLGLLLVEDEGDEESALIQSGLEVITRKCGAQLQSLGERQCCSPSNKLEVLVSAHKVIVEGLGSLPKIELVDDVEAKSATKVQEEVLSENIVAVEKKPTSSTSSADLILPILIYCIVKCNPPQMASNLLYIQRFHAEALIRGEASYCLVNVQAAVAFLENVEPASLGLTSDLHLVTANELEQQRRRQDLDGLSPTMDSNNTPSMPTRMRSRVAHDVGELAGMSNRVITGVLGSSLGAFGRMMGAGTNYAMGIDPGTGTPRTIHEGQKKQKSLEDIRGILSGGAAAKLGSVLNKVVAMENEGKGVKESVTATKRPRAIPRNSYTSRPATDYGADVDDEKREEVMNNLPSNSKGSITDRLASLPILSRGSTSTSTSSLPLTQSQINTEREATSNRLPSQGSSLRLNQYQPSLEPSQSFNDAPRSPNTPTSYTNPSFLLSPINPMSSLEGHSQRQIRIPASLQSPYPPLSYPPSRSRPLHVVLASTGSVASVKIPLIVESLLKYENVRIQIISTKASSYFYDRKAVSEAARSSAGEENKIYNVESLASENRHAGRNIDTDHDDATQPPLHFWTDEDEWQQWNQIGDPILHIELRRWADIVLIAPCSANTLAKINAGLCDDLLTSFLRALSPSTPTYIFPAMNTLMFMHPLTARHLAFARDELGYHIIGPIEKRLACGDLGQGAMQEWSDIVDLVVNRYSLVKGDTQSDDL